MMSSSMHLNRRQAILLTAAAAGTSAAAQSSGPLLLASAKQARTLSLVDPATYKVLARLSIAEDPHEVVVGPDHRTAWVSHLGDGRMHILSRIDLAGRHALPAADVSPLAGTHGLCSNGTSLWCTAVGSKAVAQLDPATGRPIAIVGTGQENSHMLWVARDSKTMLVANAGSGTASLFRLDQARVNTGTATPYAPNPAPDWSGHIYTTGPMAEGFAVSPDEREAWFGDDNGTITVIDLTRSTVATHFAADLRGANRLRFTPDGRQVIATTHTGPDLVIFQAATRRMAARIPIQQHGASGIAIEPNGRRAFIACPRDHFVAVVDLHERRRVTTIDVGREPDGIAWWPGL